MIGECELGGEKLNPEPEVPTMYMFDVFKSLPRVAEIETCLLSLQSASNVLPTKFIVQVLLADTPILRAAARSLDMAPSRSSHWLSLT